MSAKRCINDSDAPVSVPDGRWGRRRVRTNECEAVLAVEDIYSDLVRVGKDLRPGTTFNGIATVGERRIPLRVEVRANRVWRTGRLFFVCPCGRRCTRLYVPVMSQCASACRRCWGLTYSTRTSRNYKDSGSTLLGLAVTHRSLAHMQSYFVRERRAVAARWRQTERRQFRDSFSRNAPRSRTLHRSFL